MNYLLRRYVYSCSGRSKIVTLVIFIVSIGLIYRATSIQPDLESFGQKYGSNLDDFIIITEDDIPATAEVKTMFDAYSKGQKRICKKKKNLDSFQTGIVKLMKDFGTISCANEAVKVVMDHDKVSIFGVGIERVIKREILYDIDGKKTYLGVEKVLIKPEFKLWNLFAKTKSLTIKKKFRFLTELNQLQISFVHDSAPIQAFVLALQPHSLPPPVIPSLPNIFIVSIEQASSAHIQRKLPLSTKYMRDVMGITHYQWYNPVSESFFTNKMAALTGSFERSDGVCLFDLADKLQYATMFSDDNPDRKLKHPISSQHDTVAFFNMLNYKHDVASKDYCVVSTPIYEYSFNYMRSFISSYPKNPKLASITLSQITQTNFNAIGYMDASFKEFLSDLALVRNTIVVINTVKGSLIGKLGKLPQAIYEHKRPYLGIYFSPDIRDNYKLAKTRQKQITTPFDVYVTLKQMLSKDNKQHLYGRSLFSKVTDRSCGSAGIQPEMCSC